jgi:hypothetical protein
LLLILSLEDIELLVNIKGRLGIDCIFGGVEFFGKAIEEVTKEFGLTNLSGLVRLGKTTSVFLQLYPTVFD